MHVPVTFTSVASKAALIFWEQMSTIEDFSVDPDAMERVHSPAIALLPFRGTAVVAIENAFDFASVAARVMSVMINTTRTRRQETKVMELDVVEKNKSRYCSQTLVEDSEENDDVIRVDPSVCRTMY